MASQPGNALNFSVLTSVFSITAVVLLFLCGLRCSFIEFTATLGNQPVSLEFGIWYFLYWSRVVSIDGVFLFESCHHYGDAIDIDASWKAARAFSVVAFILGIIIAVFSCINACVGNAGSNPVRWEAPLYLLTALFTGLTLLFLNSNACNANTLVKLQDEALTFIDFPDTCSMARGAKLAISSTVFFFVSSITSFLGYRAAKAEMATEADASLNEPLTA